MFYIIIMVSIKIHSAALTWMWSMIYLSYKYSRRDKIAGGKIQIKFNCNDMCDVSRINV